MEKINLTRLVKDLELGYIKKAMEASTNGVTGAADLLSINRTTLIAKLKTYDISYKSARRLIYKEEKDSRNKALLLSHPNNIESDLWNE